MIILPDIRCLPDENAEIAIEKAAKALGLREGEIKRAEGKLNNAGFVATAPAPVVEEERQKLVLAQEMMEKQSPLLPVSPCRISRRAW